MGYPQRSQRNLPVKDCSHAYGMHYLLDRCWCDICGQTWKWLPPPKGWYSLSLSEAKNGERVYHGGDDWA